MKNNTIERYILQELSEREREEFEEHYFACPACAEEVVMTAKFLSNARTPLLRLESPQQETAAVREPRCENAAEAPAFVLKPSEATPVRWWQWWEALAPKPVLAGLCVVLMAALVVQYRSQTPGPEVTGSYFVSSTRAAGNEPRRIQVGKEQQRIGLLFNRTDASISRFRFVLVNSAGETVLQFDGAAPRDTDDVQVLLPVGGLRAGRYVLHVRDAISGAEAATLPFELIPI